MFSIDISPAADVNAQSKLPILMFTMHDLYNSLEPDGIIVQGTENNSNKRIWDKRHYCLFCGNPQSKITRHYQTRHQDERAVIEIQACSDQKEKGLKIDKLRNLGNHVHNVDVMKKGSGIFVVNHRPSSHTGKVENYVPCNYCYAYILKSEMYRHKCLHKGSNPQPKARECRIILPENRDCQLEPLLLSLRDDAIGRSVKSDDLIRSYGMKLLPKFGHDRDQHPFLREHLRRVGRLLLAARKVSLQPNANMRSFIAPTKFRHLFDATKDIAGFDSKKNVFEKPSLALKIGHSLKKLALLVQGQSLECSDTSGAEEAMNFMKLVELNWPDLTNPAHRTIRFVCVFNQS